jgi:hypothetical protein
VQANIAQLTLSLPIEVTGVTPSSTEITRYKQIHTLHDSLRNPTFVGLSQENVITYTQIKNNMDAAIAAYKKLKEIEAQLVSKIQELAHSAGHLQQQTLPSTSMAPPPLAAVASDVPIPSVSLGAALPAISLQSSPVGASMLQVPLNAPVLVSGPIVLPTAAATTASASINLARVPAPPPTAPISLSRIPTSARLSERLNNLPIPGLAAHQQPVAVEATIIDHSRTMINIKRTVKKESSRFYHLGRLLTGQVVSSDQPENRELRTPTNLTINFTRQGTDTLTITGAREGIFQRTADLVQPIAPLPRPDLLLPPIPQEYQCPITKLIMLDPVIASSGQTYERQAIERLFAQDPRDPLTRAPLDGRFIPNVNLRSMIRDFLAQYPGYKEEQHQLV